MNALIVKAESQISDNKLNSYSLLSKKSSIFKQSVNNLSVLSKKNGASDVYVVDDNVTN